MKLFAKCDACNKKRLMVKQRSYIVSKISSKPITSKGELCGRCYKLLKSII